MLDFHVRPQVEVSPESPVAELAFEVSSVVVNCGHVLIQSSSIKERPRARVARVPHFLGVGIFEVLTHFWDCLSPLGHAACPRYKNKGALGRDPEASDRSRSYFGT